MASSFVRVLGVALAATACQKTPDAIPPDPIVTRNPPAPLPTWDEVGSGHPDGATNPPSPVLIVSKEPTLCYKTWMGGMMPLPADISAAGGRVVATPAEVGNATQVECPAGQPQTLLDAYAKLPAGTAKDPL